MSLVSDERVEEMLAEIERLRGDEGLIRNLVIEECARALETYHRQNMMHGEDNGWFVNAVAAIRALKCPR